MTNKSFGYIFVAGSFLVGICSLQAAQINTAGKLEIYSDDYSFSARLIGSVQMDVDFYADSETKEHDLTSGAFIRRARIGVQGNVREWDYKIEFDNAGEAPDLKTAGVRRVLGPGKLSLGQFKVFEGLDELTSEQDTAFMERGYLSDIVPGYRVGGAYNGTLGPVGFAGTFYNLREASDGPTEPTTSGTGGTGRLYFAPFRDAVTALHFGASYGREKTDFNGTRLRVTPLGRADTFRNGEDFRFTVFDGRGESDQITRKNFEGAAINGPFYLQAEYLIGTCEPETLPVDDFTSMYAQASWVLTGESYEYDFTQGQMKRPVPSRSAGAVELAFRLQNVKRENVPDATLEALEYGVNYYANANVRFMMNYGVAYNKLIDEKTKLLSVRTQFDF